MAELPDHADVRVLPPVLFVGSLALGLVLQWLLPLHFGGGGARVTLGLAIVASGVAAGGWTFAWMRRTRQNPDPRQPTPELILGGPFRWSRNPMYVGMALIEAGIGVALGNAWLLLLLAPTLLILRRSAIEPEEEYLGRKFGEAYARYRGEVRRWL